MATSDHTLTTRALAVPVIVTLLGGGIYLIGKDMERRNAVPATIAVEGRSKTYVSPDIAIVQFGVSTGRQTTAAKTLDVLNKNMSSIIEAVKKNGVEEKDIVTQSLWLNPAYDWIDGQQVSRGFEATQNLSVKIRDIETISKILTDATNGGANQIGSISFTVDDPEELKAEAREKALENAKEKADVLAENLGVRLGKIVSYSEGIAGGNDGVYMDQFSYGMGGGGGELTVPSGQQEMNVIVTVTYEIK